MGRRKFKECERVVIKETIINAAAKVAKEQGVKNLTLRNVAKEAGYCPANIYEYFSDKEELLADLSRKAIIILFERLMQLPKSPDAPSQLLAMMQEAIEFHIQYPEACDLFCRICFGLHKGVLPEFEQTVALFANVLRQLNRPQLQSEDEIEEGLDTLRLILIGASKLFSHDNSPEWFQRTRKVPTNALKVILAGWLQK